MTKKDKETLSPRQIAVMSLLLSGKSQDQAAKTAGVSRQTVGNYLKNRAFARELNRKQKERLNAILADFLDLEKLSNKVIRKVLNDPNAKDSDKLRAAELVRKESHQLTYYQNLMVRLEAIEEWMEVWNSLEKKQEDWERLRNFFPGPYTFKGIE